MVSIGVKPKILRDDPTLPIKGADGRGRMSECAYSKKRRFQQLPETHGE